MKILITGALGHIGSKLIREIPEVMGNTEIIMIDNFLTQRYCSLFNLPSNGNYRFIEADILKTDLVNIFKDADYVIHLAAITNAEGSFEIQETVEEVNFHGTERVAKACIETGASLIFPSTTSVYGTQSEIVDEDCSVTDLKPQSPYAESKLKSELLIKELGQKNNLRYIICRFGTIYGTSAGMRFHTAVNKFCWQAAMGLPISIWRTALHQKRPYLALSDALRAITFIIQNDLCNNGLYNVLTNNLTVNDIVNEIKKHIKDLKIGYVDTKIMNQLSYTVDNKKFCDLGFEFTGNIQNSIADTLNMLSKAGGYSTLMEAS